MSTREDRMNDDATNRASESAAEDEGPPIKGGGNAAAMEDEGPPIKGGGNAAAMEDEGPPIKGGNV